ncbi:hypothetical protein [Microbacterium halophytorum]|uniref:hypothetical protein n=1 Tax=Microbacterium halophytorum TaxID=2067568 RepID=UPI000CFDBEF2|nr:hypothetical protein [Microbacterium halophytorum]
MIVRRDGDGWHLGEPAGAPWLVGIVEGAGATLWWPVEGGAPGALVWDAPRASGWIDAVWPGTTATLAEAGAFGAVSGARVADEAAGAGERGAAPDAAARGAGGAAGADAGAPGSDSGGRGAEERDGERPYGSGTPLADAARRAALAGWRAAWWPASRVAGIPALDPRLVAAELAVARAELDGALDDEDAAARALAGFSAAVARFGEIEPGDGTGADLAARAAELLAEHGAELPGPALAETRADDFALAAAGRAAPAPLAAGESPVDPASLPQGVVDPAGVVAWSVAIGAGGAVLSVAVPAAPQFGDAAPPAADLRARVADAEVPLARGGDAWGGEASVPPTFLALPPERRAAALTVVGFDPAAREPGGRGVADDLIRIAHARLAAPESASEREAR